MYFYVIKARIFSKFYSILYKKIYLLSNSHGYHFQLLGNPFQRNGFRWRHGDVGIGGGVVLGRRRCWGGVGTRRVQGVSRSY